MGYMYRLDPRKIVFKMEKRRKILGKLRQMLTKIALNLRARFTVLACKFCQNFICINIYNKRGCLYSSTTYRVCY